MKNRILIVGGVAGGATAAARLRRLDETSEIILFERGEYISFANCGLPYYIGGTINERSKLLVQTVDGMSQRYNIDIRVKSEVLKVNRQEKYVDVKNLRTGEIYQEGYDNLILSPGAKPIIPPLKGIDEADNIFALRNIPDTDAIVNYLEEKKPQKALVIGAGYIGLEMAENLKEKGLNVTLVEAMNQVMLSLDYEMACLLHCHLLDKGVNLLLEDSVETISDRGRKVILKSGKIVDTDLIISAVGIRPENELAVQAGLETGEKGAIKVNSYLQTSDESIYAVGDAVEVKDYINGHPTNVPLAWPANRQGRLVADNIYGHKNAYKGTLGSGIAKVFDLTAACTGLNERKLKHLGIEYEAVHVHPNSNAAYYPGAFPVSMKLLFDPKTGKIFGAQAVGAKGADKRIDVIATAIKGNLTVQDLPDLELCYAPPYSSGKDPVNYIGYVASNIYEGVLKTIQYNEIDELIAKGNILVDVREPKELEKLGSIPGSVNIPLGQLRERLAELPKDKTIYITCQVGLRGYLAVRILEQNGFQAVNLDGGYKTYFSVYGMGDNNNCQSKMEDTGEASFEKKIN